MFNLADWGGDLRNTLGEFVVAVTSFINQIPTMPAYQAEIALEKYGKELASSADGFSAAKSAYKKAVEAYLSKCPPAFSDNLANNLIEYDKLIVFSLRSGSKALLKEWGVDKLPEKCKWISDPLKKPLYIEGLKSLRDETSGAEEYYDYLIHCFE